MKDKISDVVFVVEFIILLILTIVFGIIGKIEIALLCFLLAINLMLIADVEEIKKKVDGK